MNIIFRYHNKCDFMVGKFFVGFESIESYSQNIQEGDVLLFPQRKMKNPLLERIPREDKI